MSTTSTPPPTTSAYSPPSNDHSTPGKSNGQVVALGVSLGILAVLLLAFILWFTLRVHRRRRAQGDGWRSLSRGATLVERGHLASRITPFGTRDAREPGKNMRIARRRDDGAWEFTDQLSPSGFGDSEPPTPVSPARTKAPKLKTHKSYERGYYLDPEALSVPPPAYCAEDAYLKQ